MVSYNIYDFMIYDFNFQVEITRQFLKKKKSFANQKSGNDT